MELPQLASWPKYPPRPEKLLASIRRLFKEGRVIYTDHVLNERMPERGFDMFDVEHVLLNGYVKGAVVPGKKPDEWKVLVVGDLDGTSRKMGVATVVIRDQRLLIATTEWEDT